MMNNFRIFFLLFAFFPAVGMAAGTKYAIVMNGYADHLGHARHTETVKYSETIKQCNLFGRCSEKSVWREKQRTTDVELNEANIGGGIEYNLYDRKFLSVGSYTDSFGSLEVYTGIGKWHRAFSHNGFMVDYGGVLLAMTHSKSNLNGFPIIAPIPALSVGYKRVFMNVTVSPRIDEHTPALMFFQMKVLVN